MTCGTTASGLECRSKAVWGRSGAPERPRPESERGLSLVEATIILSVVATLSAVLAPAITDTVGIARLARAREDVQVIGNAIQTFMADNAESQFLQNGSNGTVSQPPTRPDSNRAELLVSDGDIPALGPAPVSSDTFWVQVINGTSVDTLSNHLIENAPGEAGASRYRNGPDINVSGGANNIDFARGGSAGYNAPYAWRGPYLRSPVDPDPWGSRYSVNVAFLDPNATTDVACGAACLGGAAPTDYVRFDTFVLSAGPDKEIDTRAAQDGAVPGDDDLIFVVSSNAK